jgi:UDP-N-acetylglucosamine 2-epimerase (hydrolysing)
VPLLEVLNNILVAHIEGGEVSGTIDELIRHSVTKMSHIHLVANSVAKKRLIQLGEFENQYLP